MSEPTLSRIFENENFIAVDKPAETLSVPARTGEQDSRPVVGLLLQKELGLQIYPMHRLDFEVSGILLFAKTAAAHRFANAAFENHQFQKTYHALAPHSAASGEQRWVDLLVRGKKRTFPAPHGKESITEAKKLGEWENSGWDSWELKPITGRSHQLRVQMMLHQSPIVGDELYGSTEKWSRPGIALRAVRLSIPAEGLAYGLPRELRVPSFEKF